MNKPEKSSVTDSSDVIEYLRQHPDFFMDQPQLLMDMSLPHDHGNAVSLVEHQIALLRERNRDTRRQLDQLMKAASNNSDIFSKCQKLVLSLLEAHDQHGFFVALEQSFKRDFKCQAYSLLVFNDTCCDINEFTRTLPIDDSRETIGALVRSKKPTLGVLRDTEQAYLFGKAASRVKSAAVIAIKTANGDDKDAAPLALLALGSSNADAFSPRMGTLFLTFVADILARKLPVELALE